MSPLVAVRLLFLLGAGSVAWWVAGLASQPPIEYRLLHYSTPRPGDPVPGFGYVISVEEYLTAPQFKEVVCRVIQDQQPEGYDYLAIVFQYRLDSFSGIDTERSAQTRIADYRWIEGGSPEYSLAVFRDESGREIPARFHRFDHKTDCPFDPEEAPDR